MCFFHGRVNYTLAGEEKLLYAMKQKGEIVALFYHGRLRRVAFTIFPIFACTGTVYGVRVYEMTHYSL